MKQARMAAALVVVNLALALILTSAMGRRGAAPSAPTPTTSPAATGSTATPPVPRESAMQSAYDLPPVDLLAGLLQMMDDRSLALTVSQKATVSPIVQRMGPAIGRNTFLAAETPAAAQRVLRPDQWKAVQAPPPAMAPVPPGTSPGGLLGPSFDAALERVLKVAGWTESEVPAAPDRGTSAPARAAGDTVTRGLLALEGSLALTRDQARALAPYLVGRKAVVARLHADVQTLVDALRTEQKQSLLAFHARMIAGQGPGGISPEKLVPELLSRLQR